MTKLTTWRAKPNPAGRDKIHGVPTAKQLNGEWAEIKNTSAATMDLSGLQLSHTLYDKEGRPEQKPEVYWTAKKGLQLTANGVLRVHTGHQSGGLNLEDEAGADQHAYAEHGNFKLNNKEGDKLYLSTSTPDSAYYDQNVREGAVLTRVGDKLVDLQAGNSGENAKPWGAPAVLGDSGKAA